MIQMQIYLTETQRDELAALAKAAGIWKGRMDLPDFKATRTKWDRGQPGGGGWPRSGLEKEPRQVCSSVSSRTPLHSGQ